MTKNSQPIEGLVVYDDDRASVSKLQQEVRDLRAELVEAVGEAARSRAEARNVANGLRHLRQNLEPLYKALQAVFGDLDVVAPAEASTGFTGSDSVVDKNVAVFAAWKTKLPPSCGKIIDAMLIHGEMSMPQIKVACGIGKDTAYGALQRMKQVGIVGKNGPKYFLRKL